MAKKNTRKEELIPEEQKTYELIGSNIRKLVDLSGMTNARFAAKIDTDSGTLSNYISAARKVPLYILTRICKLPDLKDMGVNITLDTFINEDFNPHGIAHGPKQSDSHKDLSGAFMVYFYDQTKAPNAVYDFKKSRPLRCGVISIVPSVHPLSGDTIYKSFGLFFNEANTYKALELKKELDPIFNSSEVKDQYKLVSEKYNDNTSTYYGSVTFSEAHAFVQLESETHNDKGFCILNSPKKKSTENYLGGLGCLCSISHGAHTPSIQKIVFSRFPLGCSSEKIGSLLGMEPVKIEMADEAYAIRDMAKKLVTETGGIVDYMSDSDKDAILENRLNQLVTNYIKKNICSVGSISPDEDKEVYELIKKYRPTEK